MLITRELSNSYRTRNTISVIFERFLTIKRKIEFGFFGIAKYKGKAWSELIVVPGFCWITAKP